MITTRNNKETMKHLKANMQKRLCGMQIVKIAIVVLMIAVIALSASGQENIEEDAQKTSNTDSEEDAGNAKGDTANDVENTPKLSIFIIVGSFELVLLLLLYLNNLYRKKRMDINKKRFFINKIEIVLHLICVIALLIIISFFASLPWIYRSSLILFEMLRDAPCFMWIGSPDQPGSLDQSFFQSWPSAYRFLVKIPAVLLGVAILLHHWQPKKQRRARTQYKKAGENKNLNISEVTTNILTENIHGVLRVSAYSLGGVLVLAAVADTSPQEVLAGAGAITAAAGFLLRDYLMGLIANIHLRSAINKRTVESHRKAWAEGTPPAIAHPDARERRNRHPIFIGDWIEFPSYAVDGEVEAIGLRVIHIRGWDKTLHSVPLLAVNNHNWRLWDNAIHDEGRRRFVRSINVSAPSVRAIDETWLQNISEKLEGDISPNTLRAAYSSQIEPSSITTNLDAFMRYIKHYLTSHTLIDKQCTLQVMMRPHDPRDGGRITVGLMAFSKITKWTPFEELQNHIVNYCYSVMGHFDLKPFSIDV